MEKTQWQKDLAKLAEIGVGALMLTLIGGVFMGVLHVLT